MQQQEILSCAQRCTSGESNAHCYAGSSEDLAEAQALGLPLGKYHAYEELHALDRALSPEEAADMTRRSSGPNRRCQDGDEEESYGGGGGQHQHGGRWNQHEYRVKQPGQCSGCFLFWQKKGTNRPGWAVGPHSAVRPDSKGMVTGSKPAVRHRFRRRSSCSQHCGVPLWHIHW